MVAIVCNDLPRLDIKSAADRLAERHDVPELSAGLLDREPTRDHGKYLKTYPYPGWEMQIDYAGIYQNEAGDWISSAYFKGLPNL